MELKMKLEVKTEMDLNSTRRAQLEICCCSSWSSYVLHADSMKSCRRGAMASRCQGRDGFYLHLELLALRWSKQKKTRFLLLALVSCTLCVLVWPWTNNIFIYWVPSATYLAVLISLDSVSDVSGSFIFLGSAFEISWRFLSLGSFCKVFAYFVSLVNVSTISRCFVYLGNVPSFRRSVSLGSVSKTDRFVPIVSNISRRLVLANV